MRWVAIVAACLVCFPLGVGILAWLSTEAVPLHDDVPQAARAPERQKTRLSTSGFLELAREIQEHPTAGPPPLPTDSSADEINPPDGVSADKTFEAPANPEATPSGQSPATRPSEPRPPLSLTDRIDALAVDLRNKAANRPGVIADRARKLITAGKADAAIALLDRALDRHPGDFDLLVARAAACSAGRNYDEAARFYSKAVAVCDDDPNVWFNFAVTLTRIRRLDLAADAYDNLLKLMPDHLKAAHNLATLYHAQGKIRDALALWKKVTDAAPDLPAPWFHRGTIHLDFKEFEQAVACFEQVTKLESNNSNAWRNLGLARMGTEDYDRAIDALEKAAFLEPNQPANLVPLGRAYWNRYRASRPRNAGDRTAAIDRLREALAIERNNAAARETLDEIFDAPARETSR